MEMRLHWRLLKMQISSSQYMSQTIENFRNFYNPSKKRENFSIEEACRDTHKYSFTDDARCIELLLSVKHMASHSMEMQMSLSRFY